MTKATEKPSVTPESELLAFAAADPAVFAWTASRSQWHYAPHLALLSEKLLDVAQGKIKRLLVQMPPRHGKLLAHDTPILTLGGWVRHGDLRPGDHVFGRHGQPVRVIAVGGDDLANREVEFTDGSVIRCHSAHEWVIWDRGMSGREHILETQQMELRKPWIGLHSRGGRARFQVDPNVAVVMHEQKLPIPPYVLGAWLGDGSATKNCITHSPSDSDMVDRIGGCGVVRTATCIHSGTGVHTSYFRKLYGMLKREGLLGSKHIPPAYLSASKAQRLLLLAGLVDTDGYVNHRTGRVVFSNTDAALIRDVRRLVASLGWRTGISEYPPCRSSSGIIGRKTVYQLRFNPTEAIPTALKHKRSPKLDPKIRRRGIVEIRPCDPVPGWCIQVEGGVYLVGDTLIPTHNSELASANFPAWYLGNFPDRKVILASYEHNFAASWGAKARDRFAELAPRLWHLSVNPEKQAADSWQVAGHAGEMICAGVGGPITGRGADLLVIDDPVKSAEEANSETYRERAWDWYRATAYTRLEPNGAVILIQTRWHEDDLAGRILRTETNEPWEVISLPALAEENDPLGRKIGEALWPDRYPILALAEIRVSIGSYWWETLYQQRPAPPEGALFQKCWWKYYSIRDEDFPSAWDESIQSWDMAFKDTDDSSFVVGQVWARSGARVFLLDQIRERMDFSKTLQAVRALSLRWPGTTLKLVEDAANGPAVISALQLEVPGLVPVKPLGGKLSRAQAILPLVEAGNVWLPDPYERPWVNDFLAETASFPVGMYDDQVDAMSQGLQRFLATVKYWQPVEIEEVPSDSRKEKDIRRTWELAHQGEEEREDYA